MLHKKSFYMGWLNQRMICLLLIVLGGFIFEVNAQDSFITKWKTNNIEVAITDEYSIRVPLDPEMDYDFEIDWGDGQSETYTGAGAELVVEHNYADTGIYAVSINGVFPRILFNQAADKSKILEIVQWGNIQWQNCESAFSHCENLALTATDVPDLSDVGDLSYMYWGVDSINESITEWDISTITNTASMFTAVSSFNQPIGGWDVSNVTDMGCMFCANEAFNQPLNTWDVSNVVDMGSLFGSAFSFNQPLDQWDVSNVTDMGSMFHGALAFNQPLEEWDVSNVVDMSQMFKNAQTFNQPIDSWNVSNVVRMNSMFWNAPAFNQPLNSWDVSSVGISYFNNMFRDAVSFNQPLDQWDVSGINTMKNMFSGAVSFDQSLESWDISSVSDFNGMLDNCGMNPCNYNATLEGWYNASPQPNRILGADEIQYTEQGQEFRQALMDDYGWSVQGDGLTVLPEFAVGYEMNSTEISIIVSGGSGNYSFEWSGPNGFTSSDSSITAPLNGMYTVWVSDGCEEWTESFEIVSVGMDDHDLDQVQVFPNPTTGIVNIRVAGSGEYLLQVRDLAGRLVKELQFQSSQLTLDLGYFNAGYYQCRILKENEALDLTFKLAVVD